MGGGNAGVPAEVKCGILCIHNRNQLYNLSDGLVLSGKCNGADGVFDTGRRAVYEQCPGFVCKYGMLCNHDGRKIY